MARYRNPAIKQLADQQVRYAPSGVRVDQIDRAEWFVSEIDTSKEYRYPDVCERITSYRSQAYPDLVLTGEETMHDLRCFVEDLSASVDIPVESVDEPVLTVRDVSEKYNVSTKTVDRWRNRGLVSRCFRFGKRKRIGFLKSTVERFVKRHWTEVRRSSSFSQLTETEKESIVRRARRMARYGGCSSEISRRIARKMGRSPETVRYTLRTHDREHPDNAVFPDASEALTEEKRQEIYRSARRGVSVSRLARLYCRTKTSIYRIIAEVRATRLLEQPIDYMYCDEFEEKGAAQRILGTPPELTATQTSTSIKVPPGLPPYLASLYSIPLLTREQEVYYFRKMNYLKYRAAQIRNRLDTARPKADDMDAIEQLLEDAVEVKNFLIRSNLRLVVSIAKRHIKPGGNFFEMVSDGNMSLIRAIEKFDYSRGNKFSTYASWAIMKNFARSIPAEHTLLDRFRTGNEEVFQQKSDTRPNQFQEELDNRKQHELIMDILDRLDGRERDIILFRYGLSKGSEPQTLAQVGEHFGVTKERIRQLESRALNKLRRVAQEEHLDVPGLWQ